MNQTGVWSTGSPRAARRKALSWGLVMGASSKSPGDGAHRPACAHIGLGAARPTVTSWSWVARRARARARRRTPRSSREAVRAMNEARLRPEVLARARCRRPQRIAPYAAALTADVTVDGNDLSTGPDHPAPRPGRERLVGRHLPLRRLRPRRDRPRDDHRPALADVGWSWLTEALDGARRVVRRGVRDGHPGRHRQLRRDGRGRRQRADRDPRLVDPCAGRRAPRHRGSRRGMGRTAVHGGRSAAGPRGRHRHARAVVAGAAPVTDDS